MIEIRECSDKELWDEFILDNGGHPLQLWGWGTLKEKHGWQVTRVLGYEFDEPVAGAMIITKKLPTPFKAYSYVPRGPVGEKAQSYEFLEELASFAKRNYHPVCLSIEPDNEKFKVGDLWKKSPNHILPSLTIRLDLKKSESELLAVMAKKTRQYIRKSAVDVEIKRIKSGAELDKCLNIYSQTAKRADFNLHSKDYYHDVFHSLGDHTLIYGAYHQGELVAFLWLAISADVAFELYGGMNEKGQELRANYALKWYAIKSTKEWGLKSYDFGGIIGEGIATFKRSWAEGDTNLAGTFDRPLSRYYNLWTNILPKAKRSLQRLKSIKKK